MYRASTSCWCATLSRQRGSDGECPKEDTCQWTREVAGGKERGAERVCPLGQIAGLGSLGAHTGGDVQDNYAER